MPHKYSAILGPLGLGTIAIAARLFGRRLVFRHSTFRAEWRYNRGMGDQRLVFTSEQFLQLLRYTLADRSEERCGLLAGQADRVEAVWPVPNALHSPVAYQMNGREFAEAMAACNFEPLGIFHSHPAGPAVPSPTDIAQATYPDSIYVIIALSEALPGVRAFTIVEGRVDEIAVVVE